MSGLSSIVNLGYHGTSPAIADAIAASGFKGGTFPTWAGKGNIFTSNIDVAQRYGPRQLGVVTSAKNLTSPIGGGIGQGGISFGKEIVTKPAQATKGMNLYNKLMSGKYANSPLAKRLLQTGTTAIKNPFNWVKALNLPLSALTGILSPTVANAGEQEWIDMMNERWSKNYGPWTQGTPHMQNQRFRQQQLMNQRRLAMQQQIQQAEAIEAAKQKVTTGGPPSILSTPTVTTGGPPSVLNPPTPTVTTAKGPPSILSRPAPSAPTGTGGPPSQGGGGGGPPSRGGGSPRGGGGRRGRNPWGRADGGLINFYRYGGFSG